MRTCQKPYQQQKDMEVSINSENMNLSEDHKKILKARAEKLAQKPKSRKKAEKYLEVLGFLLADEEYGIEVTYIGEVYPLGDFTTLPCTPPFIMGVVNIRGQIMPIIDLRKIFNLQDTDYSSQNRLIVVTDSDVSICIFADELLGVQLIDLKKIQSSLSTLTGTRQKYLKGVTDRQMIILDMEKVLTDKNIMVDEKVEL